MASSTKYFGTYLIQYQGINADDVYAALEKQQQTQLTLEQLAQQSCALQAENLVEIFNTQVKYSKSFEEIALELGFLSQDQIDGLLRQQAESRKKLGEILVDMGVISEVQKESMLHAYINWLEASAAYGIAISSSRQPPSCTA